MMRWPHFLEFIFLVLKIGGIIGAFAGFSVEKKPGHKVRSLAFVFLAVAIGAELCDSFLKIESANEQAERFERITHPLGTIRITPLYQVSLASPLVANYAKKIAVKGQVIEPDPMSEPDAYALLNHSIETTIFIYKKNRHASNDDEPNISFAVSTLGQPLGSGGQFPRLQKNFEERRYFYDDGVITAQAPVQQNIPDDRFSDGEIISDKDLLGGRIEVRFCSEVSLLESNGLNPDDFELMKLVKLRTMSIEFPGRQEIQIRADDHAHVTVLTSREAPQCTTFNFKIPDSAGEYKKLIVP